jgi:hypothetical protein
VPDSIQVAISPRDRRVVALLQRPFEKRQRRRMPRRSEENEMTPAKGAR